MVKQSVPSHRHSRRLVALASLLAATACVTASPPPARLTGPVMNETARTQLMAERRAWWADPDHALHVDAMRPLDRVRGAASTPLPRRDDAPSHQLETSALGALGEAGAAALLVWHDGQLMVEHYGEGYGPDMLSAPASMPKPVLSLAIGAAVDRGLLDIDAPVSDHVPEWRGDPRGAITVRQALQMRSGLQRPGSASEPGPGEELMLGTDLEALVLSTPLARAPGTVFNYNNVDNALALLVLQRATGTRYADWLSRTIWQPIGAADAYAWLDRPGGMPRTFCCLLATPRSWVRVGLLIKNGGTADGKQIVSRRWIETMTAPSPTYPAFAMQIWRGGDAGSARSYGPDSAIRQATGEPFLANDMLIFDGAIGQRVYVSAAEDLVIVRIGRTARDWIDSRLPNAVIRALRRTPD